jgi:hypothetical protein
VPASPSTVTCCQLTIRCVPLPVPMTAGMPYSRATMEPWAATPPMSVTRPFAWAKRGVQAGMVVGQTRMVSGTILSKSSGERITVAGAVTWPGLTGKPRSVGPSSTFLFWVSKPDRSIGPNFHLAAGGTAAGGCSRFRASLSSRCSVASRARSWRACSALRAWPVASNSPVSR